MEKIYNKKEDIWIRPWNTEKFDDLYNRDERFFAILMKGLLSWLNQNIILYNKSINHFIFNTGSSYMYVESNGYTFSLSETSGEDAIYMKMPRCVLNIESIDIPREELSNPYVRGIYERRSGNDIKGYNAQIRRMPIELTLDAKYVLSNFNESIILIEELINKLTFQKFFNVTYLGQNIKCSVEIDGSYKIDFNKIDMTSTDTNQKNIELALKVCSNYPCIDELTEISNSKVIGSFNYDMNIYENINDNTNTNKKPSEISEELDITDIRPSDNEVINDILNEQKESSENNDNSINQEYHDLIDNINSNEDDDIGQTSSNSKSQLILTWDKKN